MLDPALKAGQVSLAFGGGGLALGDDPPIPLAALRSLFERLDRISMTGYQCDHTFALTESFLRERGLPVAVMLGWLGENGGGCDCEVMMNTAAEWEEAIGYRPPDADANPGATPDPAGM